MLHRAGLVRRGRPASSPSRAARASGLRAARLLEEPRAAFYALAPSQRPSDKALADLLRRGRRRRVLVVRRGRRDDRPHPGSRGRGPRRAPRRSRGSRSGTICSWVATTVWTWPWRAWPRASSRKGSWGRAAPALRRASGPGLVAAAKEPAPGPRDAPELGVPVAVVGARGSRLLQAARSRSRSPRTDVRHLVLEGFFPEVGPGNRPHRAPRTAGLAELRAALRSPTPPSPVTWSRSWPRARGGSGGNRSAGPARRHPGERWCLHPPRAAGPARGGGVGRSFPARSRPRLLSHAGAGPGGGARGGDLGAGEARDRAPDRRSIATRVLLASGICATPEGGWAGRPGAWCLAHLEEGSRGLACPGPSRWRWGARSGSRCSPRYARAWSSPGRSSRWTTSRRRSPLEAVLQDPGAGRGAAEVPVRLEAVLTEIGTLELWCVATNRAARWKLEFGLRAAQGDRPEPRDSLGPSAPRMAEAVGNRRPVLRQAGGGRSTKREGTVPRAGEGPGVAGRLAHAGGAGALGGASRRRRSATAQRRSRSGCGCSSPGSASARGSARRWTPGGRARPSRCSRTASQYPTDPHAWQAWWVLWRRIAGGLDEPSQARILDAVHRSSHCEIRAARRRGSPG